MHTSIRRGYLAAFFAILSIEVFIALKMDDALIRPYGGDLLAVGLVYSLIRSLYPCTTLRAVAAAFGVACVVELGQKLQLLRVLGLQDRPVARTVLGTSFDWGDVLAYLLGALAILAVERWRSGQTRL